MRPTFRLVLGTLAAVAGAHLLVYRGLLGIQRLHPDAVPAEGDEWLFLLVASPVVLAVALLCRRSPSRWAATANAALAALVATAYFFVLDCCEVSWGELVGHDVWLGDEGYWLITALRTGIQWVAFALAALALWRPVPARGSD